MQCKLQLTVDTITEQEKTGIWTAAQVVKAVKREHDFKVSSSYVARVMKEHFSMSYTMVSRLSLKSNSPRSLVVRSLYAQKMLQLLE